MVEDVSPRRASPPVHLGDGAYARFDGYQIWVGANHHENLTVALEPAVMQALVDHARACGMRIS